MYGRFYDDKNYELEGTYVDVVSNFEDLKKLPIELKVDQYGNKLYCIAGTDSLHRIDGPAFEGEDGTLLWCINDVHHRVDGPACIYPDFSSPGSTLQTEEWFYCGLLHRDNGPALTVDSFCKHYKHGKLHREDGPAVYSDDGCEIGYYIDRNLHCETGPAYIKNVCTKHVVYRFLSKIY